MLTATKVSSVEKSSAVTVRPSKVDPRTAAPFTLDQELEAFGDWVGDPIMVPPKDASKLMAETMLRQSGLMTSKQKSWAGVQQEHLDHFTEVREIELCKASIRLPKGRLFVSVTPQHQFDKITDTIPACVQTRLDEFMAGPGKKPGVKVHYLKPLCVEVDDQLLFTTRTDLMAAVTKVQEEVFTMYRQMYLSHRPRHVARQCFDATMALPRAMGQYYIRRQKRVLDAYQAKLEFERRKTALQATNTHQKMRTHGCTFEEMLALTNPLQRADVIGQFAIENDVSIAKRNEMLRVAAGQLPWFVAFSVGMYFASTLAWTITFAPPILVCDPAFVAEMPGAKGRLLKIGHFDEVAGVTHVEI